jgi:hypothetical protein
MGLFELKLELKISNSHNNWAILHPFSLVLFSQVQEMIVYSLFDSRSLSKQS